MKKKASKSTEKSLTLRTPHFITAKAEKILEKKSKPFGNTCHKRDLCLQLRKN